MWARVEKIETISERQALIFESNHIEWAKWFIKDICTEFG